MEVQPTSEVHLDGTQPADAIQSYEQSPYPYSGKDQMESFDSLALLNLHYQMTSKGMKGATPQGPIIDLGQVGTIISFYIPKGMDEIPDSLKDMYKQAFTEHDNLKKMKKEVAKFTEQDKEKNTALKIIKDVGKSVFTSIENFFRHHFNAFVKFRLRGREDSSKEQKPKQKPNDTAKDPFEAELWNEDEDEAPLFPKLEKFFKWLSGKEQQQQAHPIPQPTEIKPPDTIWQLLFPFLFSRKKDQEEERKKRKRRRFAKGKHHQRRFPKSIVSAATFLEDLLRGAFRLPKPRRERKRKKPKSFLRWLLEG